MRYLAGIVTIALLIGAGALWLSDRAGMGLTDVHDPSSSEHMAPMDAYPAD